MAMESPILAVMEEAGFEEDKAVVTEIYLVHLYSETPIEA
jgi:hypothetical protein